MATKINENSGWIYCFKRGSTAVFLDRKDRVIKEFSTYEQAISFANANIELIDRKWNQKNMAGKGRALAVNH